MVDVANTNRSLSHNTTQPLKIEKKKKKKNDENKKMM